MPYLVASHRGGNRRCAAKRVARRAARRAIMNKAMSSSDLPHTYGSEWPIDLFATATPVPQQVNIYQPAFIFGYPYFGAPGDAYQSYGTDIPYAYEEEGSRSKSDEGVPQITQVESHAADLDDAAKVSGRRDVLNALEVLSNQCAVDSTIDAEGARNLLASLSPAIMECREKMREQVV